MKLSHLINQFESALLTDYKNRLLPSHKKALQAMKICRTQHSPVMQTQCADCDHHEYIPHSCGHRSCPHCQHHESQQWIARQCDKQVPANYFMITFTLPAQLRALAWQHQRQIYTLMFKCTWETLNTFSQNDKQLQGTPGVIAVLHTHSRALDQHPHIHSVIPGGAIDKKTNVWRKKRGKKQKNQYLFNHKALAKVFRAKFLAGLKQLKLTLPKGTPDQWVVNCQSVGAGDKTLVYLGRYLYRGVIREQDILSCQDGYVTYQYKNSKTKRYQKKTIKGADFLWLILQHILPRGFRRARNYGFLHPNSKSLIKTLQVQFKIDPKKWQSTRKPAPKPCCPDCGGEMKIIGTQISLIERAIAGLTKQTIRLT